MRSLFRILVRVISVKVSRSAVFATRARIAQRHRSGGGDLVQLRPADAEPLDRPGREVFEQHIGAPGWQACELTSGSTARSAAPTRDPWPIATMAPAARRALHQRTAALRHLPRLARGDPSDLFRQDHILERGPGGTPGLERQFRRRDDCGCGPTSAGIPHQGPRVRIPFPSPTSLSQQ